MRTLLRNAKYFTSVPLTDAAASQLTPSCAPTELCSVKSISSATGKMLLEVLQKTVANR